MDPYLDLDLGDGLIHRYFFEDADEMELVWHRDENDRDVKVLRANGWQFQYDNKMPFALNDGDILYIPAMTYHRVIKGHGNLEIMIAEGK